MGVEIDKTRRDMETGGLDHPRAVGGVEAADGGDHPVLDTDIGAITRNSRAVENHSVFDHHVERFHDGRVPCSMIRALRFAPAYPNLNGTVTTIGY